MIHKKNKFPVNVRITRTLTVPPCNIGTVMRQLYAGFRSRNARKLGKWRRGTLVLFEFNGNQDPENRMWTVTLVFRQYRGKFQAYSRQYNEFVEVKMPVPPYKDFRKLFR